jgi:two-component system, sensor histidine kinase
MITHPPSEDLVIRLDPVTGEEYRAAGDICITVRDTGPGLSPEQQQQMFREGVQFNANELQAGGGSGLGLWISREIVKKHNGVIGVTSEGLGKGSTFSVAIPVLRPLATSCHGSSRHVIISSRSSFMGDMLSVEVPNRVLVVDDSVTSVKILSRLLVNAGMEVTLAYDGIQCLEKVRECQQGSSYDLIVMDFEMPVLNGPDTTRTLRESGYTLPIIGVTGNVLPEDVNHFLSCGANVVLSKPFDLTSLLKAYSDLAMVHRGKEMAVGATKGALLEDVV